MVSLALGIGCGPSVGDSSSGSGGSTSGRPVPTSTTSNGTTTRSTTTPPMTSTTSGRESGTVNSSSGLSTGDPGPQPTAGGCADPVPGEPPPTPRGCTPVALVDSTRTPIPDSASGLVACAEDGAPDDNVFSIFRTGAVSCPFPTGECLCDADCPRGQDCICDAEDLVLGNSGLPGNRCVPTDCSSDADCSGGRCRADIFYCNSYNWPIGFHCTSDGDDCDSHTTCINMGGINPYCAYDNVMEMFTCEPGGLCE